MDNQECITSNNNNNMDKHNEQRDVANNIILSTSSAVSFKSLRPKVSVERTNSGRKQNSLHRLPVHQLELTSSSAVTVNASDDVSPATESKHFITKATITSPSLPKGRRYYVRSKTPVKEFPLHSTAKNTPGYYSKAPIMSMSMFGESNMPSSNSPVTSTASPTLSDLLKTAESDFSNMHHSAIVMKDESDFNNFNTGLSCFSSKLEAILQQRNKYDATCKDNDEDPQRSPLLSERVILRRSRPSKVPHTSDQIAMAPGNYENLVSKSNKPSEAEIRHSPRSPALRLHRQPELRLRSSFSLRDRPPPPVNPTRHSFQHMALVEKMPVHQDMLVHSAVLSESEPNGAHENMCHDGVMTSAEFSPDQKNNSEQHNADGVVRQLVRRPRTFAAPSPQDAQNNSPLLIRMPQPPKTPTSPFDKHSVVQSPTIENSTPSSIPENEQSQPTQRVFPRTNPAFCRRNRQTTVVPTGTNEPVELLPGGIVYESASPNQKSQTLDSRYRNHHTQASVAASPKIPAKQVYTPSNTSNNMCEVQPPFSQPLERKFTYEPPIDSHVPLSPLPLNDVTPPPMISNAELTPQGLSNGGDSTPTIMLTNGSSQRSLNKDSLDSGYLPSDHHHHSNVNRQSNSYRRPSSSSSEPLSSSLERSPSPPRSKQRQAARRRPAASSRRRHGNPPSTIFEPLASDASSDVSDCARNSQQNDGHQNMATSMAYHEGSMSDPDTLLHNLSLGRADGTSTMGSYVGSSQQYSRPANGSVVPSPMGQNYSAQTNDAAIPGRPLSMLISQSEVSVGTATHNLIMSGMATGGNQRRFNQPSSATALLLQHHRHSNMLSSVGGSLRLTPLQLLRKAGAAGTLPGSVGCTHGVALAAALQMYARTRKPLFSDADIELYAQQFMATHRRGLFGRKLSITEMLCWTKELIQKPMLRTTCDKAARRLCVDTFRLIQQYMGDRRTSLSSLAIAAEIVTRGWLHPNLRDEIYMQLCRQTTETPVQESLERGWELMATCLNFFPPSLHFYGYIESYVYRHTDQNYDTPKVPVSHYASYCLRQLERVVESGAKKGVKRPTIDEIDQARSSVFQPSMFGATLDDIMLVQATRFPARRLPWIQTTLSEAVLRLNGAQTEGIFRIPGDIDEVNALKARVNQWLPPDNIRDPHVPASLLKLWYRELWTPVITPDLYAACLAAGENAQEAIDIFNTLPEINRLVLAYLIRFLQVFAAPTNAAVTKMDVSNLAMVFAPNVLRCSSDDPRVIFESTRREMTFLRTLILHLDTDFVEGIV